MLKIKTMNVLILDAKKICNVYNVHKIISKFYN